MVKRSPLLVAAILALFAVLSACAPSEEDVAPDGTPLPDGKFDSAKGGGTPSIYAVGNRLDPWAGPDAYIEQIQPILARQCVVCHGCGDAPCQLKFTSYEGVLRGSNEDDLYAPRLLGVPREYDPTHLAYGRVLTDDGFIDYGQSEEFWRDIHFYSVTNRRRDSVMGRVLTQAHELTTSLDESFKVAESIDARSFQCVGSDKPEDKLMVGRAMPLGLRPLADEHSAALMDWLDLGAVGPGEVAQTALAIPKNADAIAEWETFFNPEDARGRLVSRYLYEHLFFAHLHFERSPGEFYRMVRSRTRNGAIDEIVTERAFDPPKDDAFFYRLEKMTSVLVAKSHVAWRLGPKTMARWNELFYDSAWTLAATEEFEPASDNPFAYFAAIPAQSRARFMMEHSKELVDAMVRGSVCTGSGATFAIRDRFWVWFLDPDSDPSALDSINGKFTGGPRLGRGSWYHLDPESASPLRERAYLKAYRELLQRHRPDGLSVADLWDGDEGRNPNAWLTVLRHHKSATVHTGPIAGQPETVWILSYANFERLYYNLVVQFKVWAHLAHKLETWTLMSYVRSEGEDLAATLLVPKMREELRDHPTRGWGVINSLLFPTYSDCSRPLKKALGKHCQYPTGVSFPHPIGGTPTERIDEQMAFLEQLVAERIGGGLTLDDPLNSRLGGDFPENIDTRADVEAALGALTGWKSAGWQHLPNITIIRVNAGDESWLYTLINNRIYESHERVYQELLDRFPEEDTVSILPGIIGHYPSLFVDLSLDDVEWFVTALAAVDSQSAWASLVREGNKSGRILDRESLPFWGFLEGIHAQWFLENPIDAAVLDVSEYVWPQQLDAD